MQYEKPPMDSIAFMERDGQHGLRWRYWNQGHIAIYIVACVSSWGTPNAQEWAAYIGTSRNGALIELSGVQEAWQHGCKLSVDFARSLFPEFDAIPYRY